MASETEETRLRRFLLFALPGLLFAVIAIGVDSYLHGAPVHLQSYAVGPLKIHTSTGIMVGAAVVGLPLWLQFLRGGQFAQ